MKTFKEYAWIPTALKVGKDILTHVVTKVNPSSAGAGSAVINKGYNWAKKKYKNRVVRGVKMKKTNEDMTAADAGLPVPDKGPRKKKKDLNNKISQALFVSKDLTINPPQLKQNPPNKRSKYPGIL